MFDLGRLTRPIRRRIIQVDRKARNADLRIRCRVAARFRAEGERGLLDRRAENGSLKVDEDVRGGILRIVIGRPSDHGVQRTGRIELHFLPSCCPQENRIERLWKDVHDDVTRNQDKKTMTDLLEAIFQKLSTRLDTQREPLGC